MYAVCQGAMAVECREGDDKIQNLLNCLQNYDSTITCLAERAFLKTLVGVNLLFEPHPCSTIGLHVYDFNNLKQYIVSALLGVIQTTNAYLTIDVRKRTFCARINYCNITQLVL